MRFTGSAFKQIRFTGILLLLAIVMIAGLVYWQSVEQRRQYLTSRDFRLLSVLAMQVQNLFDGHARIFQAAVDDVYYPSVTAWRDAALNDVPFLRDADFSVSDQPFRSGSRLAPPKLALDADANRFRLRVDLVTTGDGQSNDKSQAFLTVRTPLATLLGPTFLSKLQQGVFDTLALATPDGRVVFATGRRQQELQSTPLDALIPTSLADSKQFPQMARTISVQDAVVASVPYKVFLQPCCGSVAFSSSSDQARGGLLIAGLIEADALHSAALAISPTLVITGILATILAFVIWPFLRLAFIGERQRVTVWDVVQLAACSILGLAVAAIVIITADVYTRLNGDIDEQLEGLAKNLDTHLHEEIRLAYDRLSALERHFYERANGGEPPPQVIKCLHSNGTDTCPEPTAGAAIRARRVRHVCADRRKRQAAGQEHANQLRAEPDSRAGPCLRRCHRPRALLAKPPGVCRARPERRSRRLLPRIRVVVDRWPAADGALEADWHEVDRSGDRDNGIRRRAGSKTRHSCIVQSGRSVVYAPDAERAGAAAWIRVRGHRRQGQRPVSL